MQIGIIGLGDMGKLYALAFVRAGYKVCGSDLPSQIPYLASELETKGIEILSDGHQVARKSDFVLYCVEAENIANVVASFAKSTKYGAIVGGQTSVKHPEITAFEAYLPADTHIVTCHSLHGPGFATQGQTLVVIRHRATDIAYQQALVIYQSLQSNIIELDSYQQHDKIVADTQAVTHMGFESMGSAWASQGYYPWESPSYAGGIDNVKILTTLRIFSYKSHIYAGLAILNPHAKVQVRQYAKTESELFALMIAENENEFRAKIMQAKSFVFKDDTPLLFDTEVMEAFSLSDKSGIRKPNSHLSILSMVCTWHMLGINPYQNLICQTPPFKLRLGIAEYLFKNEDLLEETLQTALFDKSIRSDDLAFHTAVHEWASMICYGDMEGYKAHFEAAKTFFEHRLAQARTLSSEMITKLMD
jgi:prephenate dehydrogenase (NADP+)